MKFIAVPLVACTASFLNAATISVNFTEGGSADSTMLADDVAGAPQISGARVNNWNNVLVDGSSQTAVPVPIDNLGNTVATAVSYSGALGSFHLNHASTGLGTTGDDRMWKGYLDASESPATVSVTGISYATYDVVVYFDGANSNSWRIANFGIGATTTFGEDSENTSWKTGQNTTGLYQTPVPGPGGNQPFTGTGDPNNSEGNYVVFSGVTGSSFDLIVSAGSARTTTRRAAVNGIQIIQVPEPTTPLLIALGSAAVFLRRRRLG